MRFLRAGSLTLALVCTFALAAFAGDGSVDIDVFGRSVFNVHYDSSLLTQDFASYIDFDNSTKDELNFNPRDTRIGVRASSTDGPWTYSSVFEVDFYGSDAGNNLLPRLRLGYAEAKRGAFTLRGGQDWLPIAQQNPGTIDFGILSWAGNLWWRLPQLTLRYDSGGMQYLASIAQHRVSNDQEQQEVMPWVMGRIAATDVIADNTTFAVGGGVRSVTVDGNDYSPYLAVAEFKTKIGRVSLTAEAFTGKGVGREFVRYGLDYNADHPSGATEVASKGGFVNLSAPLADRVQLNLGAGMDDPDDADLDSKTDAAFLKNTVMYANLKIKATKQFGWGVEVMDFTTIALDESELKGQRFTFSWWYVF